MHISHCTETACSRALTAVVLLDDIIPPDTLHPEGRYHLLPVLLDSLLEPADVYLHLNIRGRRQGC